MLLPLCCSCQGALPRRRESCGDHNKPVKPITPVPDSRNLRTSPAAQRAERLHSALSYPSTAPAQTNDLRPTAAQLAGAARRDGETDSIDGLAVHSHVEQLERILLRRGLGALEADRDCCADCGRTPLAGEQVHLYGGRQPADRLRAVPPAAPRGAGRERDRPALRARPRRAPDRARRLAAARARARRAPSRAERADAAARDCRPYRLALAVDPVTVSIVVSAPREQVFDYLQDIANHPEFTDHYLVDWHLTRIDSVGRGRGRALSREGARQPLQLGRRDVRRGRAPAPDRRGRPDRQEQPHPHARRLRARARRRRRDARAASRCETRAGDAVGPAARGPRRALVAEAQEPRARCTACARSSSAGEGRGQRVTVAGG